MAIRHKEIAEIVGVSVGTVDRALHNRGRVAPVVQQKILEVAKQHGYSTNLAGKALAISKKPIKIGVVIHWTQIPFFQQVLIGLEKAGSEITNMSGELLIKKVESVDAEAHIQAARDLLDTGIHGLLITPLEDEALRDYLNEVHNTNKIPVITFNTDMKKLDRLCYVGLDNVGSGRTAAGLMRMLLSDKSNDVLIMGGYAVNNTTSQRLDGFIKEVANSGNGLEIVGIHFTMNDEQHAYRIIKSVLKDYPELAGVYMISGGQAGACRALEEEGKRPRIKLIVHDKLPETIEYINKGVIDFIIDQNAFEQGYRSAHILFNYLFSNQQPENENCYMDISIRTVHNL